VVAAQGVSYRDPDEPVEYRAKRFVLAAGYTWTSHLLLLSACSRFPNGLANNSSGLVGCYMTGHNWVTAQMEVPYVIYPGMNETHALLSRQYFRCKPGEPYVRHDLRIWESAAGREPRLRDNGGKLLLGDDLMNDWHARATTKGSARLRGYYDTHPDRNSRLTLDSTAKNRFGDPLPKIEHKLDAAAEARVGATRKHIVGVFEQIAKANRGKLFAIQEDGGYQDHPCGGARMGSDPAQSVCDGYGRAHDHENLWVAGAPLMPTGGCTNGTLTFVALTLRTADRMAAEG